MESSKSNGQKATPKTIKPIARFMPLLVWSYSIYGWVKAQLAKLRPATVEHFGRVLLKSGENYIVTNPSSFGMDGTGRSYTLRHGAGLEDTISVDALECFHQWKRVAQRAEVAGGNQRPSYR